MNPELLLTFNAGSSTIKIGIFRIEEAVARRAAKGVIDFRSKPLSLRFTEGLATFKVELAAEASAGDHGQNL